MQSGKIKTKCEKEGCNVCPKVGPFCSKHRKVKKEKCDVLKVSEKVGLVDAKEKRSNFLLTINSNKNLIEKDAEHFGKVIRFLYHDGRVREFFHDILGHPLNIIEFKAEAPPLEIGSIQSKVHHHGVVQVVHKNILQLDFKKMRSFLRKVLGYESHFDCKLLGSDTDKAIKYSSKNSS